MSKYYLMTIDHTKTFFQGALGAMSFGAYHQYTSNQIMENNNKTIKLTHEHDMNEMKTLHEHKMKELEERLEKQHRIEIDALERKFETKLLEIQSRRWF